MQHISLYKLLQVKPNAQLLILLRLPAHISSQTELTRSLYDCDAGAATRDHKIECGKEGKNGEWILTMFSVRGKKCVPKLICGQLPQCNTNAQIPGRITGRKQ